MVTYLRPLFKVGYEAMRAAIKNRSKWPGGTRDLVGTRQLLGTSTKDLKSFSKKAWQTYLGLEGLGQLSDEALPIESVQEDTNFNLIDAPVDMPFAPKDKEVVEEAEIINKNNDDDIVITDGSEGNAAATGVATVAATNNPDANSVENDSVIRVNAYKDIIRQFIGSGNEGERMQKSALLMQIGGMLMAGKSDDPGMRGFVDIVGQAGIQAAPMLFEMGVEKGKSEREIGQAALQLYMSQMDDNKRTGDFVAVWDNVYDMKDGALQYDKFSGAPIIKNRHLVSQFRANSSEMDFFMDQNNQLGFPRYTFQPSSGTGPGMFGITSPGGEQTSAYLLSKAQRDQMIKFAGYLNRPLTAMATTIMPMMLEGRNTLIGYPGAIGKMFGGAAYIAADMAKMVSAGFGEDAMMKTGDDTYAVNRSSSLGKFYNQLLGNGVEGAQYDSINQDGGMNSQGITGMSMAVLEAASPDQFVEIPGMGNMPVFVDRAGKYGVKGAAYLTKSDLEKALFDPRKTQLEIFETTLGLMLARSRQPTGRMLADVLRRSFNETKMTSILDYASNSPEAVIGKYMGLYREIYTNMTGALDMAGFIPSEGARTRAGQIVATKSFDVPGSKEMAQQYYTIRDWEMRQGNSMYNTYGIDIPGIDIPSYESWIGGLGAVVGADNAETSKSLQETVDFYDQYFD